MKNKIHQLLPILMITTISFLAIAENTQAADQKVISDDGREVLLKDNGHWQYLSTDRYANTENGQRVRLKEDGSWSYAGNTPLIAKEQVRTADFDIKLHKVVIETYKKKTQKSARIKTQTVFYLYISNSPQAKTQINIKNTDISLIEVKDNNEKNYPVISIKSADENLQPDAATTLVVRAKKSPALFDNVKSMEIVLKAGAFGIKAPITLSQKVADFEESNVDGFE